MAAKRDCFLAGRFQDQRGLFAIHHGTRFATPGTVTGSLNVITEDLFHGVFEELTPFDLVALHQTAHWFRRQIQSKYESTTTNNEFVKFLHRHLAFLSVLKTQKLHRFSSSRCVLPILNAVERRFQIGRWAPKISFPDCRQMSFSGYDTNDLAEIMRRFLPIALGVSGAHVPYPFEGFDCVINANAHAVLKLHNETLIEINLYNTEMYAGEIVYFDAVGLCAVLQSYSLRRTHLVLLR